MATPHTRAGDGNVPSCVRAMAERTIIEARVIPWEAVPGQEAPGIWGIAVRYSNGLGQAYQVGNRLEAERELARNKPVQNGVVELRRTRSPDPAPRSAQIATWRDILSAMVPKLSRLKFSLCASRRVRRGRLASNDPFDLDQFWRPTGVISSHRTAHPREHPCSDDRRAGTRVWKKELNQWRSKS